MSSYKIDDVVTVSFWSAVGLVVAFVLFLGVMACLASGERNYCYVESADSGRSFIVKAQIDWEPDEVVGYFDSVVGAVWAAKNACLPTDGDDVRWSRAEELR